MSDYAIKVEGLGKRYRIGERQASYKTLRDTLSDAASRVFRRGAAVDDRAEETIWALKDVSFELKRGEVLGVIGRNGAGKSTLLKVLSRVTEPTEGYAELQGRVGSLLEVGTGFHPELTGRENIYLNGAILGMPRREIDRRFDEIVAFAEVERFLDTPVKHYSSGMYMRLAFAVAAHLDSDILLVDEVLAVGDAEFQKKCLGKMQEMAGQERAVVFVSHNLSAVSALCGKGCYLTKGSVAHYGDIQETLQQYLSQAVADSNTWEGDAGDENLRLRRTYAVAEDGGELVTDEEIRVGLAVEVLRPIQGLIVGAHLWSGRGYELAYSSPDDRDHVLPDVVAPGLYSWELSIPANTLSQGRYTIYFNVGIHNVRRVIEENGALNFSVTNSQGIGRRFTSGRALEDIFRPDWCWRTLDLKLQRYEGST